MTLMQIDRLRSMLDDERKKRTDVELAQLPLRARVGELELELTELKLEMKVVVTSFTESSFVQQLSCRRSKPKISGMRPL